MWTTGGYGSFPSGSDSCEKCGKTDGFEKGCALIRANHGVDPAVGDYEDWAANYAQALWLEQWRLRNLNRMLVAMFSSGKNG